MEPADWCVRAYQHARRRDRPCRQESDSALRLPRMRGVEEGATYASTERRQSRELPSLQGRLLRRRTLKELVGAPGPEGPGSRRSYSLSESSLPAMSSSI